MEILPATWTALCALAFVLGMRHGFDADHLATIDGLARYNARNDPRLARLAGAFFSLGHGAVVLAVALGASTLASAWRTPGWLEASGIAISVAFLFGLAIVNLRALAAAAPGTVVAPAGVRWRLLGRFVTVRSAPAIAAVGALFALSFDTISLAALFALAAGRIGGAAGALFVATLFALGMLLVDGLNGAWISRLIGRADRRAVLASRILAGAIAVVSLAVGALTLAHLCAPAAAAWMEGREWWLGAGVMSAVLAAFAGGMRAGALRP